MSATNQDLLFVDRIELNPDSTRSKLYVLGKETTYRTIEDIVRLGEKVHGETAIPAGRYLLGFYDSPKFAKSYYTKDDINLLDRKVWQKLSVGERAKYHPHKVIWVKNVPGFQYILIHWGNTAFDTDGCLIVGSSFGKVGVNPAVLASRDAYVKLYAQVAEKIRQGNQYITYRNSF